MLERLKTPHAEISPRIFFQFVFSVKLMKPSRRWDWGVKTNVTLLCNLTSSERRHTGGAEKDTLKNFFIIKWKTSWNDEDEYKWSSSPAGQQTATRTKHHKMAIKVLQPIEKKTEHKVKYDQTWKHCDDRGDRRREFVFSGCWLAVWC